MADERLPPQDFLRECFDYDPETGVFRWKHRPERHFTNDGIARAWNARHAGTRAFVSVDKDGYNRGEVTFDDRRYRLRAAPTAWKMLTNEEPEMVDHRDIDKGGDRFSNLRATDKMGNRHNSPGSRKHPFPKGVSLDHGRFRALGRYKGQSFNLGFYDTPAEAHAAYCAWAKPIHGEFFNPGPYKFTVYDWYEPLDVPDLP